MPALQLLQPINADEMNRADGKARQSLLVASLLQTEMAATLIGTSPG
jgi:hypothetical protein